MTPLTRTLALLAVALALVVTGTGRAEDKPKPKDESKKPTVMQRKLTHSQTVLEGLATNNFTKIGAGGEGLVECIKDATWKINETEKYIAFSTEFLRRAESLKKAAKDKNLDAAALAYVDMTLTCVKCHQYLREERPTSAVPDLTATPRR